MESEYFLVFHFEEFSKSTGINPDFLIVAYFYLVSTAIFHTFTDKFPLQKKNSLHTSEFFFAMEICQRFSEKKEWNKMSPAVCDLASSLRKWQND